MNLLYHQTVVIIPTYKESANIRKMINAVFEISEQLSLLIIDDNSQDGTDEIIQELKSQYPNLSLIQRSQKMGLGTAYVTGFKWALERDFQFVVQMDCDFSHDPQEISKLLGAAQEYDLVIGSRFIEGIRIMNWSFKRLMLSNGASFYSQVITGMPITDPTSGFKCLRRKVLETVDLDAIISNGYSFQIEMNFRAWRKGFNIDELPITFIGRMHGKSKIDRKIVFEAIWIVIKLRLMKLFGRL